MWMRRVAMDLGPLRSSRDFRIIFWARVVALLGISLTLVALSIQVYNLTGSSLAVGAVNLSAGVTLLVGTLVGGLVADRFDRRQVLMLSRSGAAAIFAVLTLNAAADGPQLWIIYVAAAAIGIVDGISETALVAITPDLVRPEQLAAAGALTAVTTQLATIVGPSVAGAIIAGPGVALCYGITCAATVVQVTFTSFVRPRPPAEPQHQHPLRAMLEGLRFVRGSRLIGGLLLMDLAGSLFALPYAVFPELGSAALHGGPRVIGMLYSAPAVGAFVGALLSGWVTGRRRAGRVLTGAVLLWGLGIAGAGVSSRVPYALLCLGIAGVGMIYSEILVRAMIQHHTPSRLMGRISSLWLGQATVGMSGGNALAGGLAGLAGARIALVAGGLACMTAAAVISARLPAMRRAGLSGPPPDDGTPHAAPPPNLGAADRSVRDSVFSAERQTLQGGP